MRTAVLITLGRLPKGLELARCLTKAGCDVFVADPFGLHLSKPSRAVKASFQITPPNQDFEGFKQDLLSIIRAQNIKLVVPVSEEVLHVASLEQAMPKGVRILGAAFESLFELHDKFRFIALADQAGLEIPETHLGNTQQAQALAATKDYIVKPRFGCSGNGLRFAKKGDTLRPPERSNKMVVQARAYGREVSTFAVAHEGAVLGNIVYQGRIFSGSVATSFERLPCEPAIDDWVGTFVAQQNYSGFIAFDFICSDDNAIVPLECNPRLTSGIHFMEHQSLAKAILEPDLHQRIQPNGHTFLQEGHTSLTMAYGALPDISKFISRVRKVLSTPDVLWSWRDPLPFLLMTPMSWPILKQVMFGGRSFGEAATTDIEWNGRTSNQGARQTLEREGSTLLAKPMGHHETVA